MKKLGVLTAIVLGFAACATVTPPPPSFYLEPPTPSFAAGLTLDDRIAVEDAWTYLRRGNVEKAQKILMKLDPKSPFYAAGLVLRYGFYYVVVAPLEVFGRALTYGVEGGVDRGDQDSR
jgi:Tfp pilus assembly protein PilF